MSRKKSNVHPDYYKTDGRDRPDDAASARFSRAIAAKAASQQRPDRMGKGLYFERPEPAPPASAAPASGRAQRKTSSRAGAAKKSGPRKATKAKVPRRTTAPRKAAGPRRKSGRSAPARPTKKR